MSAFVSDHTRIYNEIHIADFTTYCFVECKQQGFVIINDNKIRSYFSVLFLSSSDFNEYETRRFFFLFSFSISFRSVFFLNQNVFSILPFVKCKMNHTRVIHTVCIERSIKRKETKIIHHNWIYLYLSKP